MADHPANSSPSSPLIAPSPLPEPTEIDLEAGPGEQIQCRICLETEGNFSLPLSPFPIRVSLLIAPTLPTQFLLNCTLLFVELRAFLAQIFQFFLLDFEVII